MSSSPASDPQASVASPCCRRCCLDEGDVCLGCGRSLGEILEWNEADGERRRRIIADAAQRRNKRSPAP
ncbi:DUF1289 domain-containing protein [Pseudomonas sp. ZM23]|uniref:DUF1289 domain-containing protein n=1 Tax=Pseudomonas triclosanedens TaxID=2961893 RepID=A0ABY6ZXA7_9PSED|nr:DUF1289 domain-containing protein [Pseudomonas triclosanedens]MCP8466891.1 DUF1289 domain-containing protein [Pseudomonas triclosanedens]MCP8470115.1 DUF1289 domain-containing protein [Pseudomonas triclosanedens]MCP8478025.1 DUF1289 domain-containing protein [Pseudomonas triclosanedens]WAI49438.1 DUF1289 domain-containing protein [Pseudomonas triclosanedens]